MTLRRALAASVIAAAWLVAAADPAASHTGDDAGPTNYETVVERVRPAGVDIRVRSIDLSSQMELRNETGRAVVVLGYEGEPYLRISPDGVFANRRSPATYLNATRDGGTPVPPEAVADADPVWDRVSGGDTARWHDHRAHWMASDDPPEVREEPERVHVVIPDWEIPFTVDGEPGRITGDLTWSPGPDPQPYWLVAALLAAALAVPAVLVPARQRALVAILGIAAGVASFLQTLGLAAAPDMSGTPAARFLAEGGLVLALAWVGSLVAAWWLLVRRDDEGVLIAGIAGLAVFLAAGISESRLFSRAHLGTAWDPTVARALTVGCLGVGAALAVVALIAARPRWVERLSR